MIWKHYLDDNFNDADKKKKTNPNSHIHSNQSFTFHSYFSQARPPQPIQSPPIPQQQVRHEDPSAVAQRNATARIQDRLKTFNSAITGEIETLMTKISTMENKMKEIDTEIKMIDQQKVTKKIAFVFLKNLIFVFFILFRTILMLI